MRNDLQSLTRIKGRNNLPNDVRDELATECRTRAEVCRDLQRVLDQNTPVSNPALVKAMNQTVHLVYPKSGW